MKGIYLMGANPAMYWSEIPLAGLFALSIIFNKYSDSLTKLYPLIIVLGGAIVFVAIYFFRMVRVSYDEIRYIGLFSSRDKAIINEGKTLKIRMLGNFRFSIILFGHDGFADFDWLKKDGSEEPTDIALFRGRGFGGKRAVGRILRYYGVDDGSRDYFLSIINKDGKKKKEDAAEAVEEAVGRDFENVTVSVPVVDGRREIHIRINKTV